VALGPNTRALDELSHLLMMDRQIAASGDAAALRRAEEKGRSNNATN
jgi:hypothetical protein